MNDPHPQPEDDSTPPTNTKATVSLVLGILAVFTFVTGIPAAILGIMALRELGQRPNTVSKGNAIIGIVAGLGGMFVLPIIVIMQLDARKSLDRAVAVNNMMNISLGALNYEHVKGTLPTDIVSANGTPLLSWRVRILPFIDQKELYERFRLDEPWDSPHNKGLVDRMPWLYDSKVGPGVTVYLKPRGKETLEATEVGLNQVPDGAANTIFLIEADHDRAVPWTKPADLDVVLSQPRSGIGRFRAGGTLVGFADGSTFLLSNEVPDATLAELLTPDGKKWGQTGKVTADQVREGNP